MKMKRLCAMFCAGALALSGLSVSPAQAQVTLDPATERTSDSSAGTKIMADMVCAEPGEKVEYGIYIANNTGFSALGGCLDYDPALAPYVYESAEADESTPWKASVGNDVELDFIAGTKKTPTSAASGRNSPLTVVSSVSGQASRVSFGTIGSAVNTAPDGYFCFFYFHVPLDAKPGDRYPIKLTVSKFLDSKGEASDYSMFDGWIGVEYGETVTSEMTTWEMTTSEQTTTTWYETTQTTAAASFGTSTTCTTTTDWGTSDCERNTTLSTPSVTRASLVSDPEVLFSVVGNADNNEKNYEIDLDGLNPSDIYSVEIRYSANSGNVVGCIGWNDPNDEWRYSQFQLYDDNTDDSEYNIYRADTFSVENMDISESNPVLMVQFWWISPFYDEELNESGDGTAYLNSVVLYREDGSILRSFPVDYAQPGGTVSNTSPVATGTVITPRTVPATSLAPIQAGLRKYDVNNNGNVTIADAVLLNRVVAGDENVRLTRDPDLDGDGLLTVSDVIEMLRALKPFSLTIGKTTAKPGETVTIPIKVFGDKGTAAGQVYISYDPLLTPVSVKPGDAYNMKIQYAADGYPLYLSWVTVNGADQIAKDGSVLAYLEFKVDENIPDIRYLNVGFYDDYPVYTCFSDQYGYQYYATYGLGYVTVLP